jgi:hypothetical protein
VIVDGLAFAHIETHDVTTHEGYRSVSAAKTGVIRIASDHARQVAGAGG